MRQARYLGAICGALLLAGCGGDTPFEPAPALTPDQRACRELAEKSPALEPLSHLYIPNNYGRQAQIEQARRDIIEQAERNCLRDRGLSTQSRGVERPRR